MGGPSTLSLVRSSQSCPGRGICLVAAVALRVLTISIGGRLSVAKLGCPPLPHVQICVSEFTGEEMSPLQSCGDSTGWALLGANSSERDGRFHSNRDLSGLTEYLGLFLSSCALWNGDSWPGSCHPRAVRGEGREP